MKAVDLFAGAGGFSLGAQMAGLDVVWAANHDPRAVEAHAANHPETAHSCQDLRQADFRALPAYDILLASPACQGHSTASQPRRTPKHDADRSTAWSVVDCIEATRPKAAVIENVPSFTRWPLFKVWLLALETLGYAVTQHVVNASSVGVPQDRVRLFMVAMPKKAHELRLPAHELVGAETILDPAAGGWAKLSSKPAGVRARAARGRANHGHRYFLQHVTDHPGRALHRPLGTVTTVRQHWHLVEGDRIRALTTRELARAQGFPDSFHIPAEVSLGTRLVGNAVPPPVAAALIRSVAAQAA